jgi:hypothetical protein
MPLQQTKSDAGREKKKKKKRKKTIVSLRIRLAVEFKAQKVP